MCGEYDAAIFFPSKSTLYFCEKTGQTLKGGHKFTPGSAPDNALRRAGPARIFLNVLARQSPCSNANSSSKRHNESARLSFKLLLR